ncbi:helix-turn-helix domain-containing protein [Glacieibacterium frigidum]|uniref:helix-turn-helix domain-containing protein n=1 Tax=Glacieibacterium frigidum TaxID=2593303 RepID=UPI001A9CB37C|nr:helix-turn-helix transcriptional regulator [Glacieibacterium frigidum]
MSDLVAQLTEGQRDCLRLVYRHMTSKDIARALDISPHTVDMRLRTAMKTLAVASRIDAARLLVESESQNSGYQPLIYQSSDVAGSIGEVTIASPASTTNDDDADQLFSPRSSPEDEPPADGPPRSAGASFRYDDARYDNYERQLGAANPELLPWGRRNTLSPGARLAWIAGIAIGSALGFGAIVGALEALKNLL